MNDVYQTGEVSGFGRLFLYHGLCVPSADHGLSRPAIQNIINSTDLHFDLVINEDMFMESWLLFSHKFKAPTLTISE